MLARTISTFILAPAVVALVIFASPWFYLLVLGLVGSAALYEYFRLARAMGVRPQPWVGYVAFWTLFAGLGIDGLAAAAWLPGIIMAAFLAAMLRRDSMRERVQGLMSTLLGAFYLSVLLYPIFPLRFAFGERLGMRWTLVLLAVIWAGDTTAMVVGKTLGRTAFAPTLSPKKTNEGAVAGLLAGILAGALLRQLAFPELPMRHVLFASLLIGIFGQLGDLAESLLKRAAEVKDSSQLIPGHGGVLDRIDSLLFAFPALYFYLLRLYSQ